MQFVAMIGERNSGKSTIIKSLTGCPNGSFRGFVQDLSNAHRIYVVCSSPQERDLPLEEFQDILEVCAVAPDCRGLVMAIQPTLPGIRLSIEATFQEITDAGVFQPHAFIINPGRDGRVPEADPIALRLAPFGVEPLNLQDSVPGFVDRW